MKTFVMKFLRDEDGLTIVEYAVAGAMITIATSALFFALGGHVNMQLEALGNSVMGVGPAAPAAP